MELTVYNSGKSSHSLLYQPTNTSLNTDLLNSGADPGLVTQTSLSRASTQQRTDSITQSGNVINLVGNGNTLTGAAEGATLNVTGNNNVLNGGSGDDVFNVVGDGNTLIGAEGNDVLGTEGNNTLIGGAGNDTFVIPAIYFSSPSTRNPVLGQSLIQDFQIGTDKLQLPSLTTVVTAKRSATSSFRVVDYNELTLTQNGLNTFISYQGNALTELQNVSVNKLKEADFVQPKSFTV
jgi:Ca2+-binding RTX toxin-like protein